MWLYIASGRESNCKRLWKEFWNNYDKWYFSVRKIPIYRIRIVPKKYIGSEHVIHYVTTVRWSKRSHRRQSRCFCGANEDRGVHSRLFEGGEPEPFSICFICACFNSAQFLLPARTTSQIASCPDAFWLRRNTRDRSRRKNKVPE